MSVAELNGSTRATVTFSPEGDVLSVAVSEPRFTAADKAVLLASRRMEADRGAHGLPLSVATDPKNQFRVVIPPPITDHVEVALSKAREAWRKKNPNTDPNTRLWRAELMPD